MRAPTTVRWPADRFLWGVLDASVLDGPRGTATRPTPQRLGYLFEGVLPGIPIEDVHAVYRRVPGDGKRFVACGIERSALESDVPPDVIVLAPDRMPHFVPKGVEAAELNLLTGSFAPPAVRRWRRRAVLVGVGGLLVTVLLVVLGLERKTAEARQRADDLGGAQLALYEAVLGPGVREAVGTAFPPERRLVAELRRLEETRTDEPGVADVVDCSDLLTEVLSRWPSGLSTRTRSLSLAPDVIRIHGEVATTDDAQRLANALATIPGWRLAQPDTEVREDVVEFTLRLTASTSEGQTP